MARLHYLLMGIPLFVFYVPVNAQSPHLKHELIYTGGLQVPFIKERTIENGTSNALGYLNNADNANFYDFDNDGVPEFLVVRSSLGSVIEIYDGATCRLKYTVTIDSATQAADPVFAFSFMDIDGDNAKELVGEFQFSPSDPNSMTGPTRLLFIDVKANKIKYSLSRAKGSAFDGYLGYAFYDMDGDGYPEVICKWHSTSDTLTRLRIYGGPSTGMGTSFTLSKNATPFLKNVQNPIRTCAKIEYYVTSLDHVFLNIFDTEGRIVRNLVDKKQPMGEYELQWDGKDDQGQSIVAGQYYYQLKIGDFISTKKVIAVK